MNARRSLLSPRHARRHARRLAWSAAGAIALLGAGVLSGCGTTTSTATDPSASTPSTSAGAGSSGSASAAPSDEASSSAPVSGSASVAGSPIEASSVAAVPTVTVPIYYVMRTPKGPRLVREMHAVASAAPLAGAVSALEATPADPDYTSYYRPGDLGDAHYDGSGFTAVLTDPSLAARGALSKAQARIAVQQLVYTLAAVQGAPHAATRVIANGATTPLFGIPTAKGVRPGDQLSTLSDINVLSPVDGSTQSGTLVARGLANSPEANVPWKITDSHGAVVKHGAATATGWMDRLYPWSKRIDISGLAAGTYTFSASTDNEADGEGPALSVDTKSFAVS